jgi:hypothetical protein
VQYAPGLFRHLKAEVDARRTRNGQFLLTGSQKFTLMKNVSESLAGRADIVELETLRDAPEKRTTRMGGYSVRGDQAPGFRAIQTSNGFSVVSSWKRSADERQTTA